MSNDYDHRPFEINYDNRARLIALEIRRLIYERGEMTLEQWAVWKENKARLEQLARKEAISYE